MAFRITHIQGSNLEVTPELEILVTQKFLKLEKFIAEEVDAMCEVELEKETPSKSGDIYRAEVNVRIAGKLYRAEATTDQIEKSIDVVKDDVEREIRKANAKAETLFKRGGRMIKRMVRFGRE